MSKYAEIRCTGLTAPFTVAELIVYCKRDTGQSFLPVYDTIRAFGGNPGQVRYQNTLGRSRKTDPDLLQYIRDRGRTNVSNKRFVTLSRFLHLVRKHGETKWRWDNCAGIVSELRRTICKFAADNMIIITERRKGGNNALSSSAFSPADDDDDDDELALSVEVSLAPSQPPKKKKRKNGRGRRDSDQAWIRQEFETLRDELRRTVEECVSNQALVAYQMTKEWRIQRQHFTDTYLEKHQAEIHDDVREGFVKAIEPQIEAYKQAELLKANEEIKARTRALKKSGIARTAVKLKRKREEGEAQLKEDMKRMRAEMQKEVTTIAASTALSQLHNDAVDKSHVNDETRQRIARIAANTFG